MSFLSKIFKRKIKPPKVFKDENGLPYVTMGWDGYPTIMNNDGYIYMRSAEMIFHGKYYKNGDYVNSWPTDPDTGIKLQIEPMMP